MATRLLLLDRHQYQLEALLSATGDLATAAAHGSFSAERAALVDRLKESLSFIFLSAQDAWSTRDRDDMDLLLALTADRGDLLERLRRNATAGSADNAELSTVSLVTSLFERAVWLVRQIGLTLA